MVLMERCWCAVKKRELWYGSWKKVKKGVVFVLVYLLLAFLCYREKSWMEIGACAVFWATLAMAAFYDHYTQEVYDLCFVTWFFIAGILILLSGEKWYDVLIFIAIQLAVFKKMYGGADCMAFISCALYLALNAQGMMEFLIVMALTFSLVGVVQLCKGNINRKGNLKKPIALIPYIAAAMLGMCSFQSWMN